MYKLYPALSFHADLEAAVAYALEIEGYRQIWMAIFEAEALGLLSAN